MVSINGFSCCALSEISGLSDSTPDEVIVEIVNESSLDLHPQRGSCAAFIFTSAHSRPNVRRGYGHRFMNFIYKHGLGSVEVVHLPKNPNSGNYVIMFIWKVDWKALSKYAKENKLDGDYIF